MPTTPWIAVSASFALRILADGKQALRDHSELSFERAVLSGAGVNSNFPKWMIAYGFFLVVMGVAGFVSNPEKAKTALMSGAIFGGLAIALGWCARRWTAWPRFAALALTTMLTGVFCWRSSVSWTAFASGQSEKLVAALLITAMGLASVAMLITALRAGSGKSPAIVRS